MKKIILALLLLAVTINANSQNSRDVIYLKNGSVIKGQIKELNPTGNIKIETADGSLFIYKMSEVEKTQKETISSKRNHEKSFNVNKLMFNYFNNYFNTNRKHLRLIDISKINGIKKEVFGQKVYEIEYEMLLQTLSTIYVTNTISGGFSRNFNETFSYSLADATGWDATLQGSKVKIDKGTKLLTKGSVFLQETDNGWRVSRYKNKSFRPVSNSYQTKSMRLERTKKLEELKSAGEWKTEDKSSFKTRPTYYEAPDFPIFKNVMFAVAVKKYSNSCDCRNDNLEKLRSMINRTVLFTHRHTTSFELEALKKSSNLVNYDFLVKNISYSFNKEMEAYVCNISILLDIKYNLTSPYNYSFNVKQLIRNTSQTVYRGQSKSLALTNAINSIKYKVKSVIYKYEPIVLRLKKIETDDKGNPTYLVFNKNKSFFKYNKLKIRIVEKESLSISKGIFKFSKYLGKLTIKKYNARDEIRVKVNSRLKKNLKNYIDNENSIVGVSII